MSQPDLLTYYIHGLDWDSSRSSDKRAGGWLALTATAYVGVFVSWIAYYFIFFRWDGHELAQEIVGHIVFCSVIFLPWLPISWFRIRNSWLAGCVTFVAAMVGIASAVTLIIACELTADERREAWEWLQKEWGYDAVFFCMIGVVVFIFLFVIATFAFYRTKRLFSEKSGDWLKSYTVKKRFIVPGDAGDINRITVDDIMNATIVTYKYNSYRIVLYLDCIADGDHKLGLLYKRKKVFLTFDPKRNNPITRFMPVDKLQIARIAEKFGPIKRDYFYAICR